MNATVAARDLEAYFGDLAAALRTGLAGSERFAASFSAEDTDFVRMNHGKVRQPGTVSQRYLSVRLIDGQRHAEHTVTLSGQPAVDRERALSALRGLRSALADAVDDPHLLLPAATHSSRDVRHGALPTAEAAVDAILDAAAGTDFVGLYASGPVFRGFANSEGQRNWHAVTTFNLQWSLYHRADKAVKAAYAGFDWDPAALRERMDDARTRLALLARPAKSLAPGAYRAYLTPAAMEELTGVLSWGGFSARALATKQSPLTRMETGERMDPRVTLTEDTAHGVAAAFQGEGFDRPPEVSLVRAGELVGSLVSPRTAREFGLVANGANGYEAPEALVMGAGDLPARDALAALDRGLYVGNLHYLNYSDRTACRVTGMTRFATFWVEGGQIVAPVDVLRFDDTVYRLLGSKLEALTAEREMLLSSESYGSRQLTSAHVPGALVSEMAFTL
ncbi:MAG: TldE/PmbA family protein [Proteobacteria bacterium]|nr:TldE/PmbA family protein [Pseudomonadota bacterium]